MTHPSLRTPTRGGDVDTLDGFLQDILHREASRGHLVHVEVIPTRAARFAEPDPPLPAPIRQALRDAGIHRLYTHQVEALAHARSGKDVLVVTGTASGKSLAYQLPVLETLLREREARALFLFPTKALEQDQLKSLQQLIPWGSGIRAEILDGDTPAHRRAQLKAELPHILISNPDILHLSLLPYHAAWKGFWENLRYVVLDELHTYKGIFGSHIAHVLRRLHRVTAFYGSRPGFITCSATISNPSEFAGTLAARDFARVDDDGSPARGKRFVLVNPTGSPYGEATDLLLHCIQAGFKTIAFAKARKIAELITMWAHQAAPQLRAKIRAYRAGYRPEERRAIEQGLFHERLLAVVSTSALELGIDVGGLDACLLVGYPGSIASTWQRGGRVGRAGQEALIILIALPDALDQYFIRHPRDFFARTPEAAVIDPGNRRILLDHLVAAAAELPLTVAEAARYGRDLPDRIAELQAERRLVQSADGREWYARRRNPAREISIRAIGEPFAILDPSGKTIGSLDTYRAIHECHPGAVYLHQGRQFEVTDLDLAQRKVRARPVEVDYYTQTTGEKETEILHCQEFRQVKGAVARLGRLKVTERITGFEKRRIFGQDRIGSYPLDLPPHTFETQGLWLEIPDRLRDHVKRSGGGGLHFMGGIHAVEHAMIGLFPLFALCDRGDVGGISYTFHPQVGRSAIFLYDGYPEGIGLAERCYRVLDDLLAHTLRLLQECPCEAGCPSCIHSPKCGSGNKPLDKAAAVLTLQGLLGLIQVPDEAIEAGLPVPLAAGHPAALAPPRPAAALPAGPRILVLDVETRRSAEEVGGWDRSDRMGLAVAVTADLATGESRVYTEEQVDALLDELLAAACIIGFNVRRFDFAVLSGYRALDYGALPTLDILEEVHSSLGFRLSLSHLAQETLGAPKLADGLQSLAWFKAGEVDKVIEYCKADVDLTRRLFDFGRTHGYLLYRDYQGRSARLPVRFGEKILLHGGGFIYNALP
ncbi:MAG TPA: DEAD/DEAH box helicase [Candidatus Methylomirabilis sp.]|nr:DEAD/DEAH box helicase [Candidatus Methylomirabilis sp.]